MVKILFKGGPMDGFRGNATAIAQYWYYENLNDKAAICQPGEENIPVRSTSVRHTYELVGSKTEEDVVKKELDPNYTFDTIHIYEFRSTTPL